MDVMKLFFELWDRFWKRRYYLDGLVILFFLGGLFYLKLVKVFGPHVSILLKSFPWPLRLSNWLLSYEVFQAVFFLLGAAGIIILAFFVWKKNRDLPKIKKDSIGILFAPNFSEDDEKDVERLFAALKQEIKKHDFRNKFTIKKLPPNHDITSHEEAVKILTKTNAVLAVWGMFDKQNESVQSFGFSTISFTCRHVPIGAGKAWFERVLLPMLDKKWQLKSTNVPVHRQVLARNISLVVRDLIGLALYVAKNFKEAEIMFAQLSDELLVLNGGINVPIKQRILQQVRMDYAASVAGTVSEEYYSFLFNKRLYSIPPKMINGWLAKLQGSLSRCQDYIDIYLLGAIFYFLLGNTEKAIDWAKRAEEKNMNAFATPNFSLAFLYNFIGNFRKSRRQYYKGMAKSHSFDEWLVRQSLYFIRQTIEKYPDKKQLKLAMGIIEYYRGSRELGVREIEDFLGSSKDDLKIKDFYFEGQRLLIEARKQPVETSPNNGM